MLTGALGFAWFIKRVKVVLVVSTYVFVPGAWLGSWVWKKIIPVLRSRGHEVYAVTLTGMGERSHLARKEYGMATAVQDVVKLIEYEDLTDVVLVGHSFAGKVVSAVYDLIPHRIRLLFYLDSFVPEKTRDPQGGVDSMDEEEKEILQQTANLDGDGWRLMIPEKWKEDLTYDIKGADRDWFFSKLTPWPIRLAFEPVTLSERVDRARKAFIFCEKEGEPFPDESRSFIDSLRGPVRIITAGHYPMITKPEETVKALLEFAKQD